MTMYEIIYGILLVKQFMLDVRYIVLKYICNKS